MTLNAMYVVRHVHTHDGLTHVIATMDDDPTNRVAVIAKPDGSTVYGWESIESAELHVTIKRQPNYVKPGDVLAAQTQHLADVRDPTAPDGPHFDQSDRTLAAPCWCGGTLLDAIDGNPVCDRDGSHRQFGSCGVERAQPWP